MDNKNNILHFDKIYNKLSKLTRLMISQEYFKSIIIGDYKIYVRACHQYNNLPSAKLESITKYDAVEVHILLNDKHINPKDIDWDRDVLSNKLQQIIMKFQAEFLNCF